LYLLLILLGLIVAAAATFLLATLSHDRTRCFHPRVRTLDVAIAASLLVTLVATIPATPWGGHSPPRRVFLLPFQELIKELREDDAALGWVMGEMVANVLLFLPLGFLIPLRWPWWADAKRLLFGAALASLGIESIQFALSLGRTSSTTDVLLNAAGAGVGYLLLVLVKRRGPWPFQRPDVPTEDRESGQRA
jgi:glycopeptide antibiotics resistance protein